jgi:hypothetical protein
MGNANFFLSSSIHSTHPCFLLHAGKGLYCKAQWPKPIISANQEKEIGKIVAQAWFGQKVGENPFQTIKLDVVVCSCLPSYTKDLNGKITVQAGTVKMRNHIRKVTKAKVVEACLTNEMHRLQTPVLSERKEGRKGGREGRKGKRRGKGKDKGRGNGRGKGKGHTTFHMIVLQKESA